MKKLLLAPALLCAVTSANAQLALQNFNSAGIPAGWTMINVDLKTISSTLNAKIVAGLAVNAWMKWPSTASDSMMISTSLFSPAGTADRWLITPPFLVSATNTLITWQDAELYSPGGLIDNIEVKVGLSTATVVGDFTTSLYSGPVTATGVLTKKGLNLSAYNGQTIRLAFRSNATNAGVVGIDNVQTEIVTPKTDLALTSITPISGSLQSYGPVSSTVSISGTVMNNGTSNVTSYKVNYKIGAAATVTETKTATIVPFSSASFSFAAPVTLAASSSAIKVWVEMAGDATATNDSMATQVSGYNTKPSKRIVAEEPTGTWCGYCVRGIVYMDSIHKEHPDNFSLIAVHNSDPMVIASYDALMGTYITGYPSLVVDRRIVADPSNLFDIYGTEKDAFGVADISATPTITAGTLSLAVTVTPTVDINADYRLALVLTEDDVAGTGSSWNQVNYYSGGSLGAMKNAEYDFVGLANPVPAAKMKYDFVARGVYPMVTGGVGTLPATMTSGTPYTYTFSGISLGTWNQNKMNAVVMMINGADGTILNSQTSKLTNVSVAEANAGVSSVDVYPNPATDVVNAKFSLTSASSVSIQVLDAMGKVVKTVDGQNLTAGAYSVPVNVSALASGVYMVKINTDKGSVSHRISIVK